MFLLTACVSGVCSLYSDGENVTAQEVVGYIDDAIEDLYEHGARK